jgi:AcrR family transcriptional regulator
MRADALRNRQRILEAAEEIFAREGVAVPVDVVAERAGVGVGTLYRHFPTKEALFEAIVVSRLTSLVEATKADQASDPGDAFFGFLNLMAEQVSLKHDLFDALAAAGVDVKSRCGELMHQMEAGVDRLRRRAVSAGYVRKDVETEQVIGLVIGACLAAERPGVENKSCDRMIRIVCDGLRPR